MRALAEQDFRPAASPQPLPDEEIHLWFFPQWSGPSRGAAESAPVRQLLAGYAGLEAAELAFARNEHGKPRLANATLEFNLSHSGDALLIALSKTQALGVDLEMPRRPRPVLELAGRYFDPDEAAALAALPLLAQQQAFLRVWACKEAVLKAHGGGISLGLELVTFALDSAGAVTALVSTHGALGSSTWQVVTLALGGGCGALAWRGTEVRLQAYTPSWRDV